MEVTTPDMQGLQIQFFQYVVIMVFHIIIIIIIITNYKKQREPVGILLLRFVLFRDLPYKIRKLLRLQKNVDLPV
jgi:hypothetical protein